MKWRDARRSTNVDDRRGAGPVGLGGGGMKLGLGGMAALVVVGMLFGINPLEMFGLIGQVSFTGGTGAFLGATGVASFIGSGQFISASVALTRFDFSGNVTAVPEPGSWALILAGLGCLSALARHRRQG